MSGFAYDGVGNLTTVPDPLIHRTTMTYNPAAQALTTTTSAGITQFGYDQDDLATISDRTGKTTTHFTDGGGRLLSVTTPAGQRPATTTTP